MWVPFAKYTVCCSTNLPLSFNSTSLSFLPETTSPSLLLDLYSRKTLVIIYRWKFVVVKDNFHIFTLRHTWCVPSIPGIVLGPDTTQHLSRHWTLTICARLFRAFSMCCLKNFSPRVSLLCHTQFLFFLLSKCCVNIHLLFFSTNA